MNTATMITSTHAHDIRMTTTHDHDTHEHEHGRNFAQIKELIQRQPLVGLGEGKVGRSVSNASRWPKAKFMGCRRKQVHFHEVGAVDSIVDIVGGCIALEMLGKPRVLAGAGGGRIRLDQLRARPVSHSGAGHAAILGARGIGVTQCEEPQELVTPTGAALLAEFAESFGPMQGLVAEKIGFGLGTRDNKTRPNVLRADPGRIAPAAAQDSE